MKKITIYQQGTEKGFTTGKLGEGRTEILPTEVTNQDLEQMLDTNTDYYKGKIEKLVRTNPFNTKK